MSINFDITAPWSGITDVTVDGQAMVKIPKFYYKRGNAATGSKREGKTGWWVCDHAKAGYSVHPAFMKDGAEIPYFLRGKYEAYNAGGGKAGSAAGKSPWVSIDNPGAISACAARNTGTGDQAGWHLQTIYEVAACQMLMLLEYASPDMQAKIGSGNSSSSAAVATGSTNAKWRGICEAWGNVWEHVDGCKGNGTTLQVFDNKGNRTYVNTGITPPSSGYPKDVYTNTGEGYDLGALFIPSSTDATASNGSFGDYFWGPVSNFVTYYGGVWADGAYDGAFSLNFINAASSSTGAVGFRLAKWPTAA